MSETTFFGCTLSKNNLFLEMKQNLRECSIPSLAPTSRFKKKRLKFKTTTSKEINAKSANSKTKRSYKAKAEFVKNLYAKIPEDFKFYLKFELKKLEFENYKGKIKELKNSKIRSTFGGSQEVDKKLEELMDSLYSIVHELKNIGRPFL
jgi:hypothetical protein